MELSRDVACFKRLNWRFDLPPGSDGEALAERLAGVGYTRASYLPGSILLRSPDKHEVVIVPRTLRGQIRIHYMTEDEDRRFAAERVFVTIVKGVLGRLQGSPQPA